VLLLAAACADDTWYDQGDPSEHTIESATAEIGGPEVTIVLDSCILDPEIEETDDEVQITVTPISGGVVDCFRFDVVNLEEPLGDRALVDGGRDEPIPVQEVGLPVEVDHVDWTRGSRRITLVLDACDVEHVDVKLAEFRQEVDLEVRAVSSSTEDACATHRIRLEAPLRDRRVFDETAGGPVPVEIEP
jgi:hypothetical protein